MNLNWSHQAIVIYTSLELDSFSISPFLQYLSNLQELQSNRVQSFTMSVKRKECKDRCKPNFMKTSYHLSFCCIVVSFLEYLCI